MFGQKNTLVVWVSGKDLQISGIKSGVIETLVYPPQIVANLEIIDHDGFSAFIKEWATKHVGLSADIVWVFAHDFYYSYVVPEADRAQWETAVAHFLDLLPFEEVESRVYTPATGMTVVAINKDFYAALKRSFALHGFATRAEIAVAQLERFNQATTLTTDIVASIQKNTDDVVKNRIVSDSPVSDTLTEVQAPKKKSNLGFLLGIFGVLVIILVYMILTMNR